MKNSNFSSKFKLYQLLKLNKIIVLCCLLSTTGVAQSNAIEETLSLESQFLTTLPSPIQIQTFKLRAHQKVQDFADFLTLLSDGSFDANLRREVLETSLGLFEKDDLEMQFYHFKHKEIQQANLRDFLENMWAKGIKLQCSISQISESNTTNDFQWTLEFLWYQQHPNGQKVRAWVTMEVVLKQVEKVFGTQSKMIWEVLLGRVTKFELMP